VPKYAYKDVKLRAKSMALVRQANAIIGEYQRRSFSLTLRQLYYQFVARGFLRNSQKNYKRLGEIVNDARLGGLIDWNAIIDVTRYCRALPHWSDAGDIVASCAPSFHVDMWKHQEYRPEVWIEKDALVGIFTKVCNEFDVPLLSCRGYTSQSEMWRAGNRLQKYLREGKSPVVLHFGDHDPSGLDMSRDIADRLTMFMGGQEVSRLALNMDQIDEYQPPPNPCKMTDSRAKWYLSEYGHESWELDALDPDVVDGLVRDFLAKLIDKEQWAKDQRRVEEGKKQLAKISQHYDKVVKYVNKLKPRKGK
jgi:hypothetical protein